MWPTSMLPSKCASHSLTEQGRSTDVTMSMFSVSRRAWERTSYYCVQHQLRSVPSGKWPLCQWRKSSFLQTNLMGKECVNLFSQFKVGHITEVSMLSIMSHYCRWSSWLLVSESTANGWFQKQKGKKKTTVKCRYLSICVQPYWKETASSEVFISFGSTFSLAV